MSLPDVITVEVIEKLSESVPKVKEPRQVATELVAAVDTGRVEGDEDSFALTVAAELAEAADEFDWAALLYERAATAYGPSEGHFESLRARVLFRAGRQDEAMAVLASVRPLLDVSLDAVVDVTEALWDAGHLDVAHEWLTDAASRVLSSMQQVGTDGDVAPGGLELARVASALVHERHEIRHELGLPHDEMDDVAGEWEDAHSIDEEDDLGEAMVPFFSRADLQSVLARWPALTEELGSTWEDHRERTERALAQMSHQGAQGLRLVVVSADELVAHAAGVDDPGEALDSYIEDLLEDTEVLPWPPERNAPCWCGSGTKYKKCCLPRSRG